MAETKSKKSGILAKLYLASYNLGQTLGWSCILYQVIQYLIYPHDGTLWDRTKLLIIIFQNAAILEIVHAAIRLVSSNAVLTTFQVLSRVIVVEGVILATPLIYAAESMGLPLALLAWSITEVIRYFYYFLNLFNIIPHLMIWLRYTTFIILYPIGVTGELLCMYAALQYAYAYPEAWSYILPNALNFSFSYSTFLIGLMLCYIPLFPLLYMHMFAQRRKMLNPSAAIKKTH